MVNEGLTSKVNVYIHDERIFRIEDSTHNSNPEQGYEIIDAEGLHLIPGVIDDQVHFREPGLEHKGEIYTEAKAAIAGGITSFMEMPNTNPQTLTQELLEKKYERAAQVSLANYSFYMGASNDNLDEILKTDPKNVCGIKVFMGASTGNMLVDNPETLEGIFEKAPCLVAVHCEDEPTIKSQTLHYAELFGEDIPIEFHPKIRNHMACLKSSTLAINLAKKHNTRLHILHLSTAEETELFSNAIPLANKRITAEVCVHHLWFSDEDYARKGSLIKWNPAIKTLHDKITLRQALLANKLDVIATDHAPHTWDEKQNIYTKCPSGGPLVQHSLVTMLELMHQDEIGLETVVEKMCHAPAICFNVQHRGFIRPGYFADLVLLNLNDPWMVHKSNILYKCGWSPLEGQTFQSKITHTFVNGNLVYDKGQFNESVKGLRLVFNR
jgi:dihydroorotase